MSNAVEIFTYKEKEIQTAFAAIKAELRKPLMKSVTLSEQPK